MSDNKLVLDPGRETKKLNTIGKKRKNSNVWLIIVAIIVVVTIIGVEALSYYSKNHTNMNSEKISSSSILSGTVEEKTVKQTISGSNTLKEESNIDYKFIKGVELSEIYYRNGDLVSKGDIVAKVDKVSVMSSVLSCQRLINQIDRELRAESKSKVANKITAPANGRIKQIFVHPGEPVINAMYENNALVVISLDGMLAVTFDTIVDVTVGTEVDVTLSNGKVIKGNINSYTNGVMKVTVSDKETVVGDMVTVAYNNNVIGSGNLKVNSPLNVTAFVGNTKKINVKMNQKVKKDDVLITLSDTSYSDKYDTLVAQRSDLEIAVSDLIKLYSDGVIYSDDDGIINGLDEDLYKASKDSNETKGENIEDSEEPEESEESEETTEPTEPTPEFPSTKGNLITLVMNGGADVPNKAVFTFTSEEGMEYSFKYADIKDNIYKLENIITGNYIVEVSDADVKGYTLIVFPMSEDYVVKEDKTTYGGVFLLYVSEENAPDMPDIPSIPEIPNIPDIPGFPSMPGGFDYPSYPGGENVPGYEGEGENPSYAPTDYTVYKNVFFNVTPQNKMVVNISVDELDYSKIKLDQSAVITLDAYPNEKFTGKVTEISRKGNSNGVRSKFNVKVTLDRNDKMLDGMNASVSIIVSDYTISSIPVAAIFEKDRKAYVYTSYDEKTKTFGGETEITTGFSDGTDIEIIDGLSVGQTYWYEYYDTIDYSKAQATPDMEDLGLF